MSIIKLLAECERHARGDSQHTLADSLARAADEITRLAGENRVLCNLLRAADDALVATIMDEDDVAGLRLAIAWALVKPAPDLLDGAK